MGGAAVGRHDCVHGHTFSVHVLIHSINDLAIATMVFCNLYGLGVSEQALGVIPLYRLWDCYQATILLYIIIYIN